MDVMSTTDETPVRNLSYAQLFWDYLHPGATRAYLDCPETAILREVRKIEFSDGGILIFPVDRSQFHEEALPGRRAK